MATDDTQPEISYHFNPSREDFVLALRGTKQAEPYLRDMFVRSIIKMRARKEAAHEKLVSELALAEGITCIARDEDIIANDLRTLAEQLKVI